MELNYDLIPEELKRKAVDLVLINTKYNIYASIASWVNTWGDLEQEILESQQTKKPVDMQVLADSGVLCEFCVSEYNPQFLVKGLLKDIKVLGYDDGARIYKVCRPLYDYWHSINNFDRADTLADKLIDAGFKLEWDVTSFRITGLQDDYCMPWEVGTEEGAQALVDAIREEVGL